MAGTYTGLGDDGVDSIYLGAAFNETWSGPATVPFTGQLDEEPGASGFDIHLYGFDLTLAGATLNAAAGHEINVTGTPPLPVGWLNGASTADTFARTGTADTINDEILLLADAADVIPANKSFTLRNGIVRIDTVNKQSAVATDATLNIGAGGSLYIDDTLAMATGETHLLAGSYVRIPQASALANLVFHDGAAIIVGHAYDPLWATSSCRRMSAAGPGATPGTRASCSARTPTSAPAAP